MPLHDTRKMFYVTNTEIRSTKSISVETDRANQGESHGGDGITSEMDGGWKPFNGESRPEENRKVKYLAGRW